MAETASAGSTAPGALKGSIEELTAALQALVRSEVEKWGRILRNAGVQPE